MSLHASSQVWNRYEAGTSKKMIMLALADWANDDGESCHPSMDAIARKTCHSIRRVQELIRELERDGILEVQIGTGPNGCNRYSLKGWLQSLKADKPTPPAILAPRNHRTPQSSQCAKISAIGVRKPAAISHPNSQEQSVIRQEEKKELPPPAPPNPPKPPPAVSELPPELQREWRIWLDHLAEKGITFTRYAHAAQLLELQRNGVARSIGIIRFSIAKNAKNLLWECADKDIPKQHRFTEKTTSTTQEPPHKAEWLTKVYPDADPQKPFMEWPAHVRQEFAAAHPHLNFAGAMAGRYLGRAA